jgi:hypothetical protein
VEQKILTEIVKNPYKIFGFVTSDSLHLQQIAFQFISLCFSCIKWGASTAKAESIYGIDGY